MQREHATEVEAVIQDDLGTRLPAQAIEFLLDQFVAKAERKHHIIDTGIRKQPPMSFEQTHTTKPQQALGQLLILGLLQAQPAACGKNYGSHANPKKSCADTTLSPPP
jgi:hypothetical protein